jgi:poly-beta-1,6-N-acetyl-D-glucosamine synthase
MSRLVAVVSFLNEEAHLPTLLRSIDAQTRPPDRLLLVDDGSSDGSPALAEAFSRSHGYATTLRRERRVTGGDRLADAPELRSFTWALSSFGEPWDVVAKLDADLRLAPRTFAAIEAAFRADARLGVAGPRLLSVDAAGRDVSHRTRPEHVEGAAKFYRRACFEEISPIPPILGWDTIDETRARINGWKVRSVPFDERKPLHLRPTGSHDGAVRGFRRRGAAAWGYGAHPLNVLVSALTRMRYRPFILGGLAYLGGWLGAALSRAPRAEPAARRYLRREQLRRLQATVLRGGTL